MTNPSFTGLTGGCPYCSGPNQQVFHGGACPRVKAIEYHPSGGIKRVEFHEATRSVWDAPYPGGWRKPEPGEMVDD